MLLRRLFYYKIDIMAQRVTFYIDGFNFYYGLRRTKRNEPQWGDYCCLCDTNNKRPDFIQVEAP